jgi:uncharacterized protein VirK/YbjX
MPAWISYPISIGELQKNVALVHPGVGWRHNWKRFKLLTRGVLCGRWNVRWQEYLNTPFMTPYAEVLPQLYLKVQLPYLNRHFGAEQRLEILRTHYDFMRDHMAEKLRHRLLIDSPVYLARWATSTGDFSLYLDFPKRFWQEGEIELGLFHWPTLRLVSFIHFSITGPSEMSIGCLQGGKPVTNPNEISHQKLASAFRRDMHGLRHKSLLVLAARRLARAWSITSLRAVSSEAQIWSDKVVADYNTFWTEEGGVLAKDGMFDLPLETASRGPRTKAMYQRRDRCTDEIGREIEESLVNPWRVLDTLGISAAKEPAGTEAHDTSDEEKARLES